MSERLWRGPIERQTPAGTPSPEFPEGADLPPPAMTRREWLTLMGASAALAGAGGCSRGPAEFIVPYVDQPPEVTPSVPSRYATTMAIDGYGVGMIVTSHEGRPTKVEGNPHHPASGGALGTYHQASILSLYDPGRTRAVLRSGEPTTWRAFAAAITAPPPRGKRIHLLLEPTSAPHVADLVARVRRRGVSVHFDSPVARSNVWAGAKLAFGRALEPRWDFARAAVVVALDADFLAAATTSMAWARAWAERRRLAHAGDAMSRLYVAEPRLTVTGMAADERLRLRGSDVQRVAAAIVSQLATAEGGAFGARDSVHSHPSEALVGWARAVARDLRAHAGAGLVVAGDTQPPEVHALAHAANELLGNVGATVTYAASPIAEAGEEGGHGLDPLLRALDAGEVSTLVIVGGNPVYSAAADREFARRVRGVPTTAYVGPHANESADACEWFAPEAHFLEAWSDARAVDGTPSIVQPLMRPIGDAWTAAQVLAAFEGIPSATSRELVEAYWRSETSGDFQGFWQRALIRGVVADALPFAAAPAVPVDGSAIARILGAPPRPPSEALEIAYYADARVYDGRFADNAWLEELPDPVTKLTWDNAALIAPATAEHLGVATSDVVDLDVRGRSVRVPVFVLPGMADDVVALALGYGQTSPGRVSDGVGANAFAVRDSRALWFDEATVRKTGATHRLAVTQEHWSMEGRPIVLTATADAYRARPSFAAERNARPKSLYRLDPTAPVQWGMTIDLNACTGCSACVVACMAENNVPVVGRSGVLLSREMHWLRIDRYFVGDAASPAVVVQPMLCQHCEHAPCEYVCPVNATVHSPDGLNEMVYNRCVGTRFCSNNCPYKVRRFNFFNYTADKPDTERLAMNPDVTVRARGVMEKCTYCVQRIRRAEIVARREHRPMRDGEVVTACQQTCPTAAIAFGDIADPSTAVSQSRQSDRMYQVLHELGTVPRTRYLARITNPNPDLAGA